MSKKIKSIIVLVVYSFLSPLVAAEAGVDSWQLWLDKQVEKHPAIIAEKKKMQAKVRLSEGGNLPIYNPELLTEYERDGSDNNLTVGVSQTLDWWNQQKSLKTQSGFEKEIAEKNFIWAKQQQKGAVLQAIIHWESAKEKAKLAQKQEEQLATLIKIVKQRQKTGDLGQVDAELTYLSLSQRLNETASSIARLQKTRSDLQALLVDWSGQDIQIPEAFWQQENLVVDEALINQHPLVQVALQQWNASRQEEKLAKIRLKSDPTVEINAGNSGNNGLLRFNLTIPLNIRNNYQYRSDAAIAETLSAEANYQAVKRQQSFLMNSALSVLKEYQKRYVRWVNLMSNRAQRSEGLIKKLWLSGDMSTTEYLLALQQRSEGLGAGIELKTQFQSAYIDWLLVSGQI